MLKNDANDYEKLINALLELNNKKRALEFHSKNVAPSILAMEYKKLAEEYKKIDAKANYSYCMNRFRHYVEELPIESGFEDAETAKKPEVEEHDPDDGHFENWQSRVDIGD